MPLKTRQLFRQEAWDHLSSPEELDQMIQVVKPRSWLALLVLFLLITATGVWSVFGRIPLTVTGQGILIKPRQVVKLQAASSGRVVALAIQPGDVIKQGDVIATLNQSVLQQQLQQAQTQLAELQIQGQATAALQQQGLRQELRNLQQQQQNLKNLVQREQSSLGLLQQTQAAIADKSRSFAARKQQMNRLLQSLQQRVDSRQQLLKQQVISQDMLVQAEQEYFNAQVQLSDIEIQFKDLEIQSTNIQAEYFQRLNTIDETETKIQSLTAQATELREQDLGQSIDRANQIQALQHQIEQLKLQLTQDGKVVSQYSGQVLEVNLVAGQVVNAGSRLGTINVDDTKTKLLSFMYFTNQNGKQIQPGMIVQITPSFVKREQYGGIVGTVTQVSSFPSTPEDVAVTIGNQELAAHLTRDGEALIQVVAQLQDDPATVSGYRWSSSQGPALQLSPSTTTAVRVQVGEQAPISYLLPLLRSWTELDG